MVNNSLYTKYRPRSFDDISGQKYISEILRNQIKLKKFTHAYLFSGTRGTGKTSCARIFAKAINCLNSVDGNPCYSCKMCNQESGDFLNVFELDAASNNSVDQIKNIIEELRYTNFAGVYKVYILDEVHMLSINAFNALLKTLEEPPSNVVFILSTTEIRKIPQTVISRCQKFEFKHIEIPDISSRLRYISEMENIDVDDEALEIISYMGNGSMRDSISVLERILLYTERIRGEDVREILGITSGEIVFKFLDLLFKKDTNLILRFLGDIFDTKNYDIKNFLNSLRNTLREIIFLKVDKTNFDLLVQKNKKDLAIMEEISKNSQVDNLIFIIEQVNKILNKNISMEIEYRIYLEIFVLKYTKNSDTLVKEIVEEKKYSDIPKVLEKESSMDLDKWNSFLIHLKKSGLMVLYSLLQNGAISKIENGKIFFRCNTIGILNRLKNISTIKQIECEISKFYNENFSFEVFSNLNQKEETIEDKIRSVFGNDFDIENK